MLVYLVLHPVCVRILKFHITPDDIMSRKTWYKLVILCHGTHFKLDYKDQ